MKFQIDWEIREYFSNNKIEVVDFEKVKSDSIMICFAGVKIDFSKEAKGLGAILTHCADGINAQKVSR